jgi:hypothetical protein
MKALKNRDFFDPDFYKFMLKEYEAIRIHRKTFKGKPDEYDRIDFELDKIFQTFYARFID